ncbi:MAG: saccharopine dehydrogenase NADP-binding domain-containing protein [Anaerolineae bacterium]|jgi:short subunit dehydrogenase-like uncharacterized protein|nr:saccharopine dehydrogenase NADP-binding domain-containing protein [Anaerolineae bacterium]
MTWLLYGATGYTGRLIIEEAIARGHRPILAGRSVTKLKPLSERYGLDYRAFDLDSTNRVAAHLKDSGAQLVLHAAGPFIFTAPPMLSACLAAGLHYLDITGEIPVFENTFAAHNQAVQAGIVCMSGVGFDIVPSDCLIKYVSDQLPDATDLAIAIDALSPAEAELGVSAGTAKTMLHMLPKGNLIRRGGQLIRADLGAHTDLFPFPHGERLAMAIPWGDLSTGYRTSGGIPNITTYLTFSPAQISAIKRVSYVLRQALKIDPVRHWIERQIDQNVPGPSAQRRQTGRSYVYARAINATGKIVQATLTTPEGYEFTKIAAVRCVERVLDSDLSGALTPALAFGADFVLELGASERHDFTLN